VEEGVRGWRRWEGPEGGIRPITRLSLCAQHILDVFDLLYCTFLKDLLILVLVLF